MGREKLIFLITVFYLSWIGPLYAQENPKAMEEAKEAKEAKKTETEISTAPVSSIKSVGGEVEVVREGYIALTYKTEKNPDGTLTAHSIVLPIDENVVFVHVKDLASIKEGDSIEVLYEEVNWIDKEGIGRSERKAKEIRFIRSAVKGLISR